MIFGVNNILGILNIGGKKREQLYTTSATSDTCQLSPYSERYSNKPKKDVGTIDYLTKYLTVKYEILIQECEFHFPNVISLELFNTSGFYKMDSIISFETKYIEALKKLVNLFNLKSLIILQNDYSDLSLFLLKILKETPQLTSLSINSKSLLSIYNNKNLCEDLNRMIKKLNYDNSSCSFNNLDEIEKFCQIFSNIEQLVCYIQHRNNLLYLLNHLSQLSILTVFFISTESYKDLFSWFNHVASQLNVLFHMYELENNQIEISIWVDK